MNQIIWIGQICFSLLLGGLLGWQRECAGRPAGIRTYSIVTVGATLFTILSIYGFNDDSPSRIASEVVLGIGFIGAGTIFRKEDHVEGLTTAAGLWIAAAIGMAVATGLYLLAGVTTLLIFTLLTIDEKRLLVPKKKQKVL